MNQEFKFFNNYNNVKCKYVNSNIDKHKNDLFLIIEDDLKNGDYYFDDNKNIKQYVDNSESKGLKIIASTSSEYPVQKISHKIEFEIINTFVDFLDVTKNECFVRCDYIDNQLTLVTNENNEIDFIYI